MKKTIGLLLVSACFLTSCDSYNKILKSADYEYKYEAAKEYYTSGKYSKASTLLGELISIMKGSDKGEESLYMLGMCFYGMGDYEVAQLLQHEGVSYLAVAFADEGVQLRERGITMPIVVLNADADSFEQMTAYRLEPEIYSLHSLDSFIAAVGRSGEQHYPIHLKLDTGMHRLGFMSEEIPQLLDFLSDCDRVKVKSIYSHLAASDDPSHDSFTLSQVDLFKKNADILSDALGYRPMYHILNSAGIERFPQYQFDMVRLGIGIYGVSALNDVKLSPAAAFKCKILQIKTLKDGDGTIGYGRHGKISPEGTVIATIPVGYADGVDRHLSCGNAAFVLNGHRVPTIGNICMDMCMLDITGVEAKVGDTVTIFGEDPTITELASILGTIPYEIITSVPRRIKRIIVG